MVICAVVDCQTRRIPNKLNLAIFLLGTVSLPLAGGECALNKIIGMFLVPAAMVFINLLISNAFGGGDIKMMAAAGLFFGKDISVAGTLLGITLSGVYGMAILILGNKSLKDSFPFGPFLTAGFIIWIIYKKSEVFSDMQPYQIVGIGLIVVGVVVLVWYFNKKRKTKDEDYIERLK